MTLNEIRDKITACNQLLWDLDPYKDYPEVAEQCRQIRHDRAELHDLEKYLSDDPEWDKPYEANQSLR